MLNCVIVFIILNLNTFKLLQLSVLDLEIWLNKNRYVDTQVHTEEMLAIYE